MHPTTGQASVDGSKPGLIMRSAGIPNGILPADTVYVDKGTPWANPFTVGIHGTRKECLSRYEILIASSPDALQSLDCLKGKNLVVHCDDDDSHAFVLAHLASINYRARLDWAENILDDVSFKLAA